MADKKQLYIVSHINRTTRDGKEVTYFDRIGSGFVNKDGSFNFRMEKLPTGITPETVFHLGPYKPKEKREAEGFSE